MAIVAPALSVMLTTLPRSSAIRKRRVVLLTALPSYQVTGLSIPGPWT